MTNTQKYYQLLKEFRKVMQAINEKFDPAYRDLERYKDSENSGSCKYPLKVLSPIPAVLAASARVRLTRRACRAFSLRGVMGITPFFRRFLWLSGGFSSIFLTSGYSSDAAGAAGPCALPP